MRKSSFCTFCLLFFSLLNIVSSAQQLTELSTVAFMQAGNTSNYNSDSIPTRFVPYEYKHKGFLKPYKLYHGDTAINISTGWQFRYASEFKRQFEPYPLAHREMLKSQTYHYVGLGSQIVFTLFAAINLYDGIKCSKKITEGKVCNPRPSHDVLNSLSIAGIWYYGSLKAQKHRKKAIKLLNEQR